VKKATLKEEMDFDFDLYRMQKLAGLWNTLNLNNSLKRKLRISSKNL
jgi:hypothetical protein